MASLHRISVDPSDGQKRKLLRAYRNREELTLRLAHKELSGSDVLMVPAQVVKRVQKNRNGKKGMQIKLSKSNIRKQEGSGILSSLMPVLKSVAPNIGKTLGLSALAGATSEGVSQIIKKITGGQLFQVPNKNLYMLAQLSHLLSKGQRNDLANAHNLGRDLLFKITQEQVGNGIGTVLASIGIPIVLDALKGLTGRGAVRMGSR